MKRDLGRRRYLVAAVQGFLPQLQLQLAGGSVEVAADHRGLQLLLRLLVLLQLNPAQLQVPVRRTGESFLGTQLDVKVGRRCQGSVFVVGEWSKARMRLEFTMNLLEAVQSLLLTNYFVVFLYNHQAVISGDCDGLHLCLLYIAERTVCECVYREMKAYFAE